MPPSKGLLLGRELDATTFQPTGAPLLYDPDHLTTHGVCFGMTGSGKTGLCLVLLEEAIRAGIPCLLLDLKGDLANLALTFPALRPSDFEPWLDPAEAARQGIPLPALAEATAGRWRSGLAESGLGPGDVAALRGAAEIAVFTPGSTAGRPVNVLGGFAPPPGPFDDDAEAGHARIVQTVAALLDLAKVDADPLTSAEAVYLAGSFERAWRRGETVTLEGLIRELSEPPIQKLGVMDLDDLFPKSKRMAAAMALNALVAAPSFATWTQGVSLDPAAMLRAGDGRPRAAICYLAHLSDRERQFFVAALLAAVVGWMRRGAGSSSLKALIYMDELFGYLPPHPASPPSKEPLLTLLKQARAYGVGVMLASQNPVDVDYKGLANAGTWILGRLQTEQDRERLLDGMTGVAGAAADRAALSRLLGSLPPRAFVLQDAKEGRARLFASRWAMSFLRGPLTRDEIRRLPEARGPAGAIPAAGPAAPDAPAAPSGGGGIVMRPKIADGIPERFLGGGPGVAMTPHLYASVRVLFEDAKAGIRESRERTLALPAEAASAAADWAAARPVPSEAGTLSAAPPVGSLYASVPASWQKAAFFRSAATSLKGWIAANESIGFLRNRELKLASRPGEARGGFEARCREESERRLDEELRAYQARIQEKARRLQARIEKEEADVERDRQEASLRKTQEAVGLGASVLGAIFGSRRSLGTGISGAASRRRLSERAEMQAGRSRLEAEAARQEYEAFRAEAETAVREIEARWRDAALAVEETLLRPKKSAVEVVETGVLWAVSL